MSQTIKLLFSDLAKNLGFTIESKSQQFVLSDKQRELVDAARRDIVENPDKFLDWDDARKTLKID